jgi:hypothetical protein
VPGNDGLHNQIAEALANTATQVIGGTASINNMRGAYPSPKASMPPAPITIIGPPTGRLTPGSSQEIYFIKYPMRVYVGRLRDSSQTMHDVNEWVDAFLIWYRGGISLGGLVTQAVIESWDTDKFYEIGGEDYQAVDFVIACEVYNSTTYTS